MRVRLSAARLLLELDEQLLEQPSGRRVLDAQCEGGAVRPCAGLIARYLGVEGLGLEG